MAIEYFLADQDIQNRMHALVEDVNPSLYLPPELPVVVFRSKAAKSGGEPVLGRVRKVDPLTQVLSRTNYDFVIELAEDEWKDLTSRQQEALLDHLLRQCKVTEDPKSGKVTTSIGVPDMSFFKANVERYGLWFPAAKDWDSMRFKAPEPAEEKAA